MHNFTSSYLWKQYAKDLDFLVSFNFYTNLCLRIGVGERWDDIATEKLYTYIHTLTYYPCMDY